MCGLTGSFNSAGPVDIEKLIESTEMIKYRGPDDYGYALINSDFEVSEIDRNNFSGEEPAGRYSGAFGFRRLSIIDLSEQGHQPMTDPTRKFWIEFNGEIYNYLEIREELKAKGYKFRSSCDTEVILYSYIEWGDGCVERFEGMWSFCILDTTKRRLFCSVDRFGIKPFYYFFNGIEFNFGSEIKQVLNMTSARRGINYKVLFDYLVAESYGNESEETFFTGIKKILPGHNLIINLGGNNYEIHSQKYWELKVNPEVYCLTDEKYIREKIRELFFYSVRLRLRSDVEVGTCLSGGIDSSSIVCAVDRITGVKPQKLFTILSGEGKMNEYNYAKEVCEKVGGNHFIKTIETNDLKEDIRNLIWHNDEPLLKASMYGGYYAYKLAAESGTKVILDGQGIDEYAGGYFSPPYQELLYYLRKSGKLGRLNSQMKFLAENGYNSMFGIQTSMLKYNFKKFIHEKYNRRFRIRLKNSSGDWFNRDFVNENVLKSQIYDRHVSDDPVLSVDEVKNKSYKLVKYINLPGILRQVDRNSMAFSVEARVPYLERNLVAFIYSLPSEFIIRNNITKYSFRESMRGVVPENILNRTDKIGFYIDEFSLLKEMKDVIKGYVESIDSDNGIYNKEYVLNNLDNLLEKRESYDTKLWRYINGIIWANLFKVN